MQELGVSTAICCTPSAKVLVMSMPNLSFDHGITLTLSISKKSKPRLPLISVGDAFLRLHHKGRK